MSCAASSSVVVVVFGLKQQKQIMATVSPLEGYAVTCRTEGTAGPRGPGEDTVRIVLEVQTAGASGQPLRTVSHLLCLAPSQPLLYCLCGLLCTGLDLICTGGASSQNKMCCSLSLPAPSFSDAAC